MVFGPWYARRVLGVPISRYWFNTWLRPMVSMVPFAMCTAAIEKWWPAANLVVFFAQVLVALLAAAAGGWFLGLGVEERRTYGRALARAFHLPGRQPLQPGG
jgi:hypothetical protein